MYDNIHFDLLGSSYIDFDVSLRFEFVVQIKLPLKILAILSHSTFKIGLCNFVMVQISFIFYMSFILFYFFKFQVVCSLFGAIIIVMVANSWLLIPSAVILIIFYILRAYFLPTSCSIKRLENISKYIHICKLNFTIFIIEYISNTFFTLLQLILI